MKVVALDPGGTTGWACLDLDEDVIIARSKTFLRDHVTQGQLGNNSEHHKLLWMLLTNMRPDVIVCERFKHYGNEFAKIMSREYIGIVKLYQELYGCELFQPGSDKKEWASDRKLRILLILCVPFSRWKHANDALRHLVYYIVFEGDRRVQACREYILDQLKELVYEGQE